MANEEANSTVSDNMQVSNRSESNSSGGWKFPLLKLIEKELFNCQECGSFFKTGVYSVSGVGTVCEECVNSSKWQGERVKFFDAFLQDMPVVPCANAEAGCILQVLPEDMEVHLENCLYRPVPCIYPGCVWKENLQKLTDHFQTHHTNDVIDENKVFNLDLAEKSFVVAKLLMKPKPWQYYFLLIRRELNSDDILYNMFRRANYNNNDGLVRHFCNDTQEYTKRIKIEPLNMIDKNNCVLNRVSCSLLNEICDGDNQLSVTVDFTLSKTDKMLMCSGCQTTMRPPIYQCENQHNICDSCSSKLSECPVCKNKLKNKTRNVSLEALTSNMLYSCAFSRGGCQLSSTLDELKQHEAICYDSTNFCPLPNCSYVKTNYEPFKDHVSSSHLELIMSNSYQFKSSQYNCNARYNMYCHDRFFELITTKSGFSQKFEFSIKLLDKRSKDRLDFVPICFLCIVHNANEPKNQCTYLSITRHTEASVLLSSTANPLIRVEVLK